MASPRPEGSHARGASRATAASTIASQIAERTASDDAAACAAGIAVSVVPKATSTRSGVTPTSCATSQPMTRMDATRLTDGRRTSSSVRIMAATAPAIAARPTTDAGPLRGASSACAAMAPAAPSITAR